MQDAETFRQLGRRALRFRWLVFGILALAYVSAFFHRISPAVVAVDLQDAFGISGGLLGLLASVYFYSYAVIQVPSGLLSDSWGPRRAVSIFLLVGGVGSILFGAAQSLNEAIFGRVMVGLGAGMVFTPTMKIVSEWFRPQEFSRMNALLLTMGGLGALSAATPMALLTTWLGWRAAFEAIGLATLFLALLVMALVRNRPADLGWPSLAEMDHLGTQPLPVEKSISLFQGARRVVMEKHFWPVALWSTCSIGTFFAFGGLWAGPYLTHVYGTTRAETGRILDMLSLGIIVGSFFMSYLSESVVRSRKKVLRLTSFLLLVELLFLSFRPQGLPTSALFFAMLAFSICSLAPAVISVTTTKELFPVQMTGTSVGMVNMFPFLGSALLQVILGWTLDAYPKTGLGAYPPEAYCRMFRILLIPAAISLACTFLMRETYLDPKRGVGSQE